MTSINHKAITDHLIDIGFTQPVQGKNGCWVNENSTIVYYSANNGAKPIYTVCHKLDRWEFNEPSKLDLILGVIAQKIKV